jgi:hypothetical protein
MYTGDLKMKDRVVGVLYYDMKGSSGWSKILNTEEKSSVQAHCKNFFMRIAEKHNVSPKNVTSRGDDSMAFFNSIDDCVSCGLEFLDKLPEMIRMCPYLGDIKELTPRIIAIADTVTGADMTTCIGDHFQKIVKDERRYSEGGSFRIIGEHSFSSLPTKIKEEFKPIDGTKGNKYKIYEAIRKYDTVAISEHHINIFPFHQEILLKFYSSNFAARNAITKNLIARRIAKKEVLERRDFTQQILDCCRVFFDSLVAFGDLTPSASYPSDAWFFKLSYWMPQEGGKLRIYAYSYPDGMECFSYEKGIPVAPGENIPGECFSTGKVVVRLVASPEYKALHGNRAKGLIAVAAFPVIDPISGNVEGVLSIDTSVKDVFTDNQIEVGYLEDLLSSFTLNLVLANHLGHIIS